uniref:UDP-galactose transporter n=1 Tax=Panagrolaimus sp. JU765 TaxID=591449 RepID=A0AC34QKJ4_9BILA
MTSNDEETKRLDEDGENSTVLRKKTFDFGKILKYTSLIVLVVQNAGLVLIMRYASTRPKEKFLKTVAVFFAEVIKLLASFVLLNFSNKSVKQTLRDIRYHFVTNWLDTFKVGVPAFVYTIQNFLLFVAVENLTTGVYMVTYQLKILTTAGFTVLMLKRKLSLFQWISLVVLLAGVVLVQKDANDTKVVPTMTPSLNGTSDGVTTTMSAKEAAAKHGNPIIGFITVLVACFLSGFAGIYFEKILKGSRVSVWMRNIQLAALSAPIAAIMIAVKDGESVQKKGVMQGFDWIVWTVVLVQAIGGLVVAVVIKYADNILKAFATSIAIIVGTIASIFFFGYWPQLLFVAGATLVISAVVIYSIFPYKAKHVPHDVEMEERQSGKR